MLNFLAAIENGNKPVADIEEGTHLYCKLHSGKPGYENGERTLRYDPKTKTVLNDAEATALLARNY
jgi:hypothetical protein